MESSEDAGLVGTIVKVGLRDDAAVDVERIVLRPLAAQNVAVDLTEARVLPTFNAATCEDGMSGKYAGREWCLLGRTIDVRRVEGPLGARLANAESVGVGERRGEDALVCALAGVQLVEPCRRGQDICVRASLDLRL